MSITDVINTAINIFGYAIPILMALGTIVFMYGVIGYILSAGEEEKREEFKKFIVWGIIGLFAMVAVWGMVRLLVYTFGISGGGFGLGQGPIPGAPPYPPNSSCVPGQFFCLLREIAFFVISPLIRLMFVLATAVFLWGVVQFIGGSGAGDEKKIETGKKHIMWGIVALFIMVAMWGIVTTMQNTFGWQGLPYLEKINP